MQDIQNSLYKKSKRDVENSLIKINTWKDFLKAVKDKRWIKALHCGDAKCEMKIKDETQGVKTNCIPFDQPKSIKGNCVYCKKPAKYEVLFAKSY